MMTSSKLFWVLLSAYLLVQVQCGVGSYDVENEKSIIDIAKAALQALEKIVEGVTTFSLLTLNGLETTLKNLEGLVLKVAKFEVDKVGDQIFEKLDELKKGANIIAVDIIDCTEGREQDLKDLLVTFLNKTGDCAVNRINEVLDSFATVVVDIRNINEEIKTITVKLDECGTDANPTACVIEVIKEIEDAAAMIPAKVNEHVKEAKERVDEIVNYLFECEHDYINELEMKSQEIYNGIVECVEGKIDPNVVFLP